MNARVAAAVAALVGAAAGLSGIQDPDVWMHLRTGQLIATTGAIPTVDVWSHTRAGAPWITHEWAFELLTYALWSVGGVAGVVGLQVGLSAAIGALLVAVGRAAGAGPGGALVAAVAGLVAAAPRLVARPHLASAIGVALVTWACLRDRERRDDRLWLVVPLTVVWANLHAGVVLGLLIVTVFALEDASRGRTRGLGVAAAAVVAAFVNPHGWRALGYPGLLLQAEAEGRLRLVEMLPPVFPEPVHAVAAAFGVVAVVAAARGHRPGAALAALAALGLALGLTRRRASLDMALLVAPWFAAAASVVGARAAEVLRGGAAPAIGAAALGALAALGWRPTIEVSGEHLPVDAMAFVTRAGLAGQLYNTHLFGAWILWAHPERKVFFDGRNEVFLDLFDEVRDTPLAALSDRYGLGVAVIGYPSDEDRAAAPLVADEAEGFVADPSWRLVWFDDIARVYARAIPENEAAIAKYGYVTLRPGWTDLGYLAATMTSPAGEARVGEETQRALAEAPTSRVAKAHRAEYLRLVGQWEASLALFRELPRDAFALGREGAVHLQLGRAEEARAAFEAVIALEPENPTAWSNLALAKRRGGDLPGARAALERAVAIDPTMLAARRNLALVLTDAGDPGAAAAQAEVDALEERLAREAFGRGQQLLEAGDAGRAAVELATAAGLRPQNANTQYLLGVARHLAGDAPGAERALREALRLAPTHPYAKLELADVLGSNGHPDDAVALLESFLAGGPEPKWASVAERRLAALRGGSP